jgi:hypothetical protein
MTESAEATEVAIIRAIHAAPVERLLAIDVRIAFLISNLRELSVRPDRLVIGLGTFGSGSLLASQKQELFQDAFQVEACDPDSDIDAGLALYAYGL